jgi:hypothetical protein
MLYVTPILAASGLVVERHVTSLDIDVSTVRRLTRQLVRTLVGTPALQETLRGEVQNHHQRLQPLLTATSEALGQRHERVIDALERRSRGRLWQGSLFDRRAEQAASRDASHVAVLCEHYRRRHAALLQLQHLHTGTPQLVAAWLSGE